MLSSRTVRFTVLASLFTTIAIAVALIFEEDRMVQYAMTTLAVILLSSIVMQIILHDSAARMRQKHHDEVIKAIEDGRP